MPARETATSRPVYCIAALSSVRIAAMVMNPARRSFLARAAAVAAGSTLASCGRREPDLRLQPQPELLGGIDDWDDVRALFALSPDFIHMSALYVSSHPKPVRDAIERYRQELDASPVIYLVQQNRHRVNDALAAAATHLGVNDPNDIALTDSTTMGLGLVYNGLYFEPGDEVLTTTHDHYATHEALRLAALRKGIIVRRVPLYDSIATASEEQITERLVRAVSPKTRALALTWVHSGTGLRLPVRRIADALEHINAERDEHERILLCVDGVHGFGVEDMTMAGLGCDFFIAGCHKWLFGPRGTGLVWGSERGWQRLVPAIPSFVDDGTRIAWVNGTEVSGRTNGRRMSPGGFKAFEHQWALADAFALHRQIGKDRIAARTHVLAAQLKEGLGQMPHIALRTPRADSLSSGIVCFEVRRMNPYGAVRRLRERRIVATVTPYAARYVRLAPSIRNSPEEVDAVLRAVRTLA